MRTTSHEEHDLGTDDRKGVPRMTKSAAEMVAAAKGRVENLDPDAVQRELEGGDAVLIDVREPEEAANERIPGAVNVPRGMLEFRADPTSPYHQEPLDPARRVILHCASGGRSALAAAALQDMGYGDVAHLDGGISAWKEAGKPHQHKGRSQPWTEWDFSLLMAPGQNGNQRAQRCDENYERQVAPAEPSASRPK